MTPILRTSIPVLVAARRYLLDNLDDPDIGERTLDSLKNIISYKSRIVLPHLIPKVSLGLWFISPLPSIMIAANHRTGQHTRTGVYLFGCR